MEKEIKELIRNNVNDLMRWSEKRDNLINKIKFCSDHKFEEEVRISFSKLESMEGVIYDYEQMINDLKKILKSYQEDIAASES